MVRQEYDDGIFCHRRGIKRIKESAQLVVHIADRGEVTLHQMLPLPVVRDPLVPGFASVRAGIGEVILEVVGELNIVDRVEVEPFLRHLKRNVRTKQPDREKERGISGRVHLRGRPVDDCYVALGGAQFHRCSSEEKVREGTFPLEACVLVSVSEIGSWPIP